MSKQAIFDQISPITLGTVQLGLDYGIANQRGKPDDAAGRALLSRAVQLGITSFDTASQYGASESVLGQYFRDRDKPLIISKFKLSPATGDDPDAVERDVRRQLEQSLNRLGLSSMPIYMLHQVQDLVQHRTALIACLQRLVNEGLIGLCGVSVYRAADLDLMLQDDLFQATQLPVSIFDQRLFHSGHLMRLQQSGRIVFARSIFLQGLFFVDPAALPAGLAAAAPYLTGLHRLAKAENISVAQLALSFVRDLPGISSLVIGAETAAQVEDNIKLLRGPAISADGRLAAQELFAHIPETILNPALWAK
jgi:aryl-alcohol dehydrogenase-like predicted oxidoreductase